MPVSRRRKKDPNREAKPPPTAGGGASTFLAVAGLAALLGVGAWFLAGGSSEEHVVSVIVPELSARAAAGRQAFNRLCVECHGTDGAGSSAGPPLIHPVYRAGHHADAALRMAVARGVRAHHWKFGNMPPQPEVKGDELGAIIAFVRETQKANGIF